MRRTKEDAEKTRDAIMTAAETLFLKNGVSHTSLEQIAHEAGVTRGAVYWHFKNRGQLISEMINQICFPPEEMVARLNSYGGVNPLRAMYEIASRAFRERSARDKNILVIVLRRCEFTGRLGYVEEYNNKMTDMLLKQSAEIFSQEECIRHLRPGITPALAARAIHVTILGALYDWARTPGKDFPEQEGPQILNALFRGLFIDWDQLSATS